MRIGAELSPLSDQRYSRVFAKISGYKSTKGFNKIFNEVLKSTKLLTDIYTKYRRNKQKGRSLGTPFYQNKPYSSKTELWGFSVLISLDLDI